MGGYGSGGWWWRGSRETTTEYQAVRIADFRRWCELEPGDSPVIDGQELRLEWTACNFGGERPWFVCSGCSRRVGVLYRATTRLRCRRCLRLAYPSQNECERDRLLTKAQSIRIQLGGSGDIFDLFPPKPSGMHTRKYARMLRVAEEAEERLVSLLGEIS